MPESVKPDLLREVLREVSRSFYITLRILPKPVRSQIALAYLLARAADTLADTQILPRKERMDRLIQLRELLPSAEQEKVVLFTSGLAKAYDAKAAQTPDLRGESELLRRMPECMALYRSFAHDDQGHITEVVRELTRGMELDLERFPADGTLHSLDTLEELEAYTYHVAGCVGPFWTKICMAHLLEFGPWDEASMCELGIRFGKALQWTNVLRDLPRDLRNGRCYLPARDLAGMGLKPSDLQQITSWGTLKPLYNKYLDHALEHYRAALTYILEIPKSELRVRVACIVPVWIGLKTIALLREGTNPLDPHHRIRIARSSVYRILLNAFVMGRWNKFVEAETLKLLTSASRS